MNLAVNTTAPAVPELSMERVFARMGMPYDRAEPALRALAEKTLPDFLAAVRPRACWARVPVTVTAHGSDFGVFSAESRSLARHLAGCDGAVLFAATLGAEADLQRRAAAVRSPARALLLDAMGSAAIESVCDALCRDFAAGYPDCRLRPRFSPGYGDLPLELQPTLLRVLDSARLAGISLTDSLLMLPQKSVSAILGLGRAGCPLGRGDCTDCEQQECEYRL